MRTLIHIPVAGPEKLPLLWGALMTLLPQLRPGCHVRVVFNYSHDASFAAINDNSAMATVQALASLYEVSVEFAYRPNLAVAAMYVESVEQAILRRFYWVFKMDDDCLMNNFTSFLYALADNQEQDYVTMNFWDVVNHRGYDDWRLSVELKDLPAMVDQYGERTVWCHRWLDAQRAQYHKYSLDCAVNASLFAVNLRGQNVEATLAELRKFKVGQRGMDLCVSSNIGSRRVHVFEPYAIHLGVFRPQLDGKYWTEYQSEKAVINQSELQK